ncbi:MAG: alpha/beta hydrolase [Planctomycetes bacterium]|nr:alpha/beta hydrolase [Planctomycetota bacterium]
MLHFAIILFAAVAAFVLILVAVQRRLIYVPTRGPTPPPPWLRERGVEMVRFATEDGITLCGWFWPGRDPDAPAAILCHGNGGDISIRWEDIAFFHELGLQVLLFDYRGYGESEGRPDEQGLYRDIRAARAWIRSRGVSRLVLQGHSLGAAVALQSAIEDPPEALILEAPFTSVGDMAARIFPLPFIRHAILDRYDNVAKIGGLKVPLLIVHGMRDSIVPIALGERLYRAAPADRSRFIPLPDADHNDIIDTGGKPYVEGMRAFLRDHGVL